MGVPCPFAFATQHLPGNGNRDAGNNDADGENVETRAEIGDIQGEREVLVGPERENPAEERIEAIADIEVKAFAAGVGTGFGRRVLVELNETFANGRKGAKKGFGEEAGDSGKTTGANGNGGEGIESKDDNIRERESGKATGQVGLPFAKLKRAGHGFILQGCWLLTSTY